MGLVDRIGVTGNAGSHLHQRHVLAGVHHLNGRLGSGQTAADNGHPLAHLALAQVHVHDGAGLLHTLDPGDQRLGAHGGDGEVGINSLDQGGRHLGIEPDIHAQADRLTNQVLHKLDGLPLEGYRVGVAQKATQGSGFLAEDDLVSPLLGHDGGLQTAGTTAGYEHLLGRGGQEGHHHILWAVQRGIDGTLGNAGLVFRDALVAAQAGADIIRVAPLELVDEHGVGVDRPAE